MIPTIRTIRNLFASLTRSALSFIVCLAATGCLRTMEAVDPKTLPIDTASAHRLRDHVAMLASPELAGRRPGTAENRQAAQYIEAQFRAIGLQPLPSLGGYRQPISARIGDNLIGMVPASTPSDTSRWILIGAHYDHLGSPYLGADDNASSIAILIETARQTAGLSNHGILFVAFNSEESPYFGTAEMGSQFFFHHLPKELGSATDLQAVVIMDLMGGVQWEPLTYAVFAAGAEKSPGLYRHVKDTAAPPLTVLPVGIHLVEEIPGRGHKAFSDYDVFRNHQVPFLFLSAARTPRYHTPRDVAESLHYERMAATADWLRRLLARIDQDKAPYTFDAQRLEFADEAGVFRTIVEQALQEGRLIPGTSRWSRYKLKEDAEWLRSVDHSSPTPQQLERLERISIRLQCLLADYSGCFMF